MKITKIKRNKRKNNGYNVREKYSVMEHNKPNRKAHKEQANKTQTEQETGSSRKRTTLTIGQVGSSDE